jgi:hypothetical protein
MKKFMRMVLLIGILFTGTTLLATSAKGSADSDAARRAYIAKCNTYSYKDIARNPDNFKGKYAVFTGKVDMVLESKAGVGLLVRVMIGKDASYKEILYVVDMRATKEEGRILEDDIIKIYGELDGLGHWAGSNYPRLIGKYIEIK